MTSMPDAGGHEPTLDEFVEHLHALRLEAGNPSFADLAHRIARARQAGGMSPERARVARSTVYDVFRTGRRRMDIELIRELLQALGLSEEEVASWVASARRAVPGSPQTATANTALPNEIAGPDSRAPKQPTRHLAIAGPPRRLGLFLLACMALNLAGRVLVSTLGLPLHLDMMGTATAAVLAGPWWAALVGVASNTAGAAFTGASSLPFALVNVAGALVWGYGVHRFGFARSVPRFLALCCAVAVTCTIVATPILLLLYPDGTGNASEGSIEHLADLLQLFALAVVSANLLTSLADKLISGFVALAIAESHGSPSRLPSIADPDGQVAST